MGTLGRNYATVNTIPRSLDTPRHPPSTTAATFGGRELWKQWLHPLPKTASALCPPTRHRAWPPLGTTRPQRARPTDRRPGHVRFRPSSPPAGPCAQAKTSRASSDRSTATAGMPECQQRVWVAVCRLEGSIRPKAKKLQAPPLAAMRACPLGLLVLPRSGLLLARLPGATSAPATERPSPLPGRAPGNRWQSHQGKAGTPRKASSWQQRLQHSPQVFAPGPEADSDGCSRSPGNSDSSAVEFSSPRERWYSTSGDPPRGQLTFAPPIGPETLAVFREWNAFMPREDVEPAKRKTF